MAITKTKLKQLENSSTPGSFVAYDASNILSIIAPTTGADRIPFYDDSATAGGFLTLGTNLSITGTTLNASAGAGGYSEVQEEGGALTARTKLNFIGSGFTAADDAGNTRTNITLDATLNALAAYNTNGILTQTGADTFTGRTITGTAARITMTNGDGVAGNPTIDIASTYVGQATITTLGTITTGTWTGTAIAAINGGTGQTSYAVGDLLSANTTTTLSRVAAVASGSVLKSAGVSTLPVWGTLASTDLSNTANIALLSANQTFAGNNTFSNNITLNGTPSAGTDVTNVTYVTTAIGNAIAGLRKGSVRLASAAAIAISSQNSSSITIGASTLTLDGSAVVNGDLVLIKDSVTGGSGGTFNNGVYTVSGVGTAVILTRATWMDAASEIDGVYVAVEDGTANVGTLWITVSEVTTLGTDAITFTQIQTSGTIDGTGAANKVAYWTDSNTLTQTTNFHFNGSQLSIGNASPATSTVFTTQGTGTSTTSWGWKHLNSSATTAFAVADDGSFSFGTSSPVNVSNSSFNPSTAYSVLNNSFAWTFNNAGSAGRLNVSASGASTVEMLRVGDGTVSTSTASEIMGVNNIYSHTVASGTNNFTAYKYAGTLNQTGTYSGVSRGVWIVPTLTSVVGGFVGVEITATGQTALKTTAGKVQFNLGSDATGDTFYRGAGGELVRLAAGATSGHVLTSNGSGAAPSWQATAAATVVTRAYLTGSTSSVIDLDSGTAVTDVDGTNIAFTVPSDLDKTFVVRNGVTLSRSGTVSRDYTLVSATGVLTLASALTSDESLLVYKIV